MFSGVNIEVVPGLESTVGSVGLGVVLLSLYIYRDFWRKISYWPGIELQAFFQGAGKIYLVDLNIRNAARACTARIIRTKTSVGKYGLLKNPLLRTSSNFLKIKINITAPIIAGIGFCSENFTSRLKRK